MNAPCKGCEKRTPTCHTVCEPYLAFREEGIAHRAKHMKSYGLRAMLADREARNAARAAQIAKNKRMLRRD